MAFGVEIKRVIKLDGAGTTKAFCDIAVGGTYLIRGLRVVEGKRGLFVSMPREQGKNGQWYDMVQPLTKQAREHLTTLVLEAYTTKQPV